MTEKAFVCPSPECRFKVQQYGEELEKITQRITRLEERQESLEKENAEKFAEVKLQLTLLEREIRQLMEKIEQTHNMQYQLMVSMSDQLRDYQSWMRTRLEVEEEQEEKSFEAQQKQIDHFRFISKELLGWVAAIAAAAWAIGQKFLDK